MQRENYDRVGKYADLIGRFRVPEVAILDKRETVIPVIHFTSHSVAKTPSPPVMASRRAGAHEMPKPGAERGQPVIHVIDDDLQIRDGLRYFLEADGLSVEDYGNSEAFLQTITAGEVGCLLLDARLPGMSGLELLQKLRKDGNPMPVVMITGEGDVRHRCGSHESRCVGFPRKAGDSPPPPGLCRDRGDGLSPCQRAGVYAQGGV
ncbi:MAG: response regulator [Asticcacaulis sp.]